MRGRVKNLQKYRICKKYHYTLQYYKSEPTPANSLLHPPPFCNTIGQYSRCVMGRGCLLPLGRLNTIRHILVGKTSGGQINNPDIFKGCA